MLPRVVSWKTPCLAEVVGLVGLGELELLLATGGMVCQPVLEQGLVHGAEVCSATSLGLNSCCCTVARR